MRCKLFFFLVAVLLNVVSFYKVYGESCIETRAAFSIGSNSIVAKLADVDLCREKIKKSIKRVKVNIPFEKEIKLSKDAATIPQGLVYETILKIEQLKSQLGIDCKKIKCSGVATAVIMNATTNNKSFLNFINEMHNISMQVISSEEESILGFYAISAEDYEGKKSIKNNAAISISGYDLNITMLDENEVKIYNLKLPLNAFKRMIISVMRPSIIDSEKNINPLSEKEVFASLKTLKAKFNEEFTEEVKELLQKKRHIYIIGDILNNSIAPLLNEKVNYIDKVNLLNLLTKLKGRDNGFILKNYPRLAKDYVDTIMLDIIYLYSVFQMINIGRVNFAKELSNVDGLLVLSRYWNE